MISSVMINKQVQWTVFDFFFRLILQFHQQNTGLIVITNLILVFTFDFRFYFIFKENNFVMWPYKISPCKFIYIDLNSVFNKHSFNTHQLIDFIKFSSTKKYILNIYFYIKFWIMIFWSFFDLIIHYFNHHSIIYFDWFYWVVWCEKWRMIGMTC